MNSALSAIVFLGLFVAGVSLVLWFSRHYRTNRDILDPKVACALVALSFIFVGAGLLTTTLPPPAQAIRAGGKEVPLDVFATLPAGIFFCSALLAAIGLLLGAAFQLLASWLNPSGAARWRDAARLAIYGAGAFLVAIAHLTLLRLGPGLLK